jgi:hypothetical protein
VRVGEQSETLPPGRPVGWGLSFFIEEVQVYFLPVLAVAYIVPASLDPWDYRSPTGIARGAAEVVFLVLVAWRLKRELAARSTLNSNPLTDNYNPYNSKLNWITIVLTALMAVLRVSGLITDISDPNLGILEVERIVASLLVSSRLVGRVEIVGTPTTVFWSELCGPIVKHYFTAN